VISSDLHEAVRLLSAGKLVGMPTETVYGLAANALDPVAVARIFEAKNRPAFDPLIVHIGQRAELAQLVTHLPAEAETLMQAFWPGPLTLVLPKTEAVPDLVTSGLPHVAVRMPRHPLALRLLQSLPFPLAAPSANPFGYVSPTTAQHVMDQLADQVGFVLDGGPCQVGLESTVVGFRSERAIILRQGGIPQEAIEEVLGHAVDSQTSQSRPDAPGQLDSHYAPHRTIHLLEHGTRPTDVAKESWISFAPHAEAMASLAPDGSVATAAQRLFGVLRHLDQQPGGPVWIEKAPEIGLGRAVNDRLMRAAHRA
jgi:L-threonylcarbamoyladenylate synthase